MTERSTFPSDEEVHEDLMEQLLLGIHVAMPGRIQSYDPEHQVADIIVQLEHCYPDPEGSGRYINEHYPVLPAVPILFPRGEGTFLSFPMKPGTCVQLLFNSSAIGMWRRSTVVDADAIDGIQRALRGVSIVGDVARHHLTHAVALLGLETYGRPIRHTQAANATVEGRDTEGIVFGYDADDGTRFLVKPDGSVEFTQGATVVARIDPDGTVHIGGIAGQFLALANLVDSRLSSIASKFDGHFHASNGTAPAPSQRIGTLASVAATKAKAM